MLSQCLSFERLTCNGTFSQRQINMENLLLENIEVIVLVTLKKNSKKINASKQARELTEPILI